MRTTRAWGIIAAGVLALSCSRLSGPECAEFLRTYPVVYLGGAQGTGRILMTEAPGSPGLVRLELELFESPDASEGSPMLRLQGIGSCSDGTARIRFGAGGETEQLKILGGSAVGIFDPEVVEQPFGRWQVAAFDKTNEQELDIEGFWEAWDGVAGALIDPPSSGADGGDGAGSSAELEPTPTGDDSGAPAADGASLEEEAPGPSS